MSAGERLKRLLVESPTSLGEKARKRRWQTTMESFPGLRDMDVVDLGGTVDAWKRAPVQPRSVTVLNIDDPGAADVPWVRTVVGDACDAAVVLSAAGAAVTYDVVFSNAVLEHVGGHANRQRFADSVLALAPRHWVQTPYRYFPLEPHWLFPGMQFLPVAARIKIAESWPLVHSPHPGFEAARREVLWTELISVAEMRAYFPSSQLLHERVAGLTKSLIAVRT